MVLISGLFDKEDTSSEYGKFD